MISKPIILYITHDNGTRVNSGNVTVDTFPISPSGKIAANDSWAESGGKLCQKAAWWLNYPWRFDREKAKIRCHSPHGDSIMESPIFNGTVIIDWIYHLHNKCPQTKRILKIIVKEYNISILTNPILVTKPAYRIFVTKQPPATVLANHDFGIEVEIRGQDNTLIDIGLDSVAYIELTIPYNYKQFYTDVERDMMLANSSVRLDGNHKIINLKNRDAVIRMRATAGKAIFSNIRILDIVDKLQLNLTLTMARDPWERIPACMDCFRDFNETVRKLTNGKITYIRLPANIEKKILPVVFTKSFSVRSQTVETFSVDTTTNELYEKLTDSRTHLIDVPIGLPVLGGIHLVALDNKGKRIYSGPDSKLFISVETSPPYKCLSIDNSKTMVEGKAIVIISMCEVINSVKLKFFPSGKRSATYTTPSLRIIGTFRIGHIGDFRFSGVGTEFDSHINSFIQFAVNDVNKGLISSKLSEKGIKFYLHSFNLPNNETELYKNIADIKTSSEKTQLVISSVPVSDIKPFIPFFIKYKVPVISLVDSERESVDNKLHPLYNSICWSDKEFYNAVFQFAKSRYWTHILILRYFDVSLKRVFFEMAVKYNINVFTEIVIQEIKNLEKRYIYDGILHKLMLQVKKTNLKVIYLFVPGFIQPIVFREAYLEKLSSFHGFQWVLIGKYARKFPFENESVCSRNLQCTLAFTGTYLFDFTYNISGYHSKSWDHVLNNYYNEDPVLYKGGKVRYRSFDVGALLGLGYDAVHLYAKALSLLIDNRLTYTGEKATLFLRKSTVDGLTDHLALNDRGERIGYFGYLAQINPVPRRANLRKSKVITYLKVLTKTKDGVHIEIPYESTGNTSIALIKTSVSQKLNLRKYVSLSGKVGLTTQKLMPIPNEPWPPNILIRNESIIAPYFCNRKCGELLKDPGNINVYDNGKCMPDNTCICDPGFTGLSCLRRKCPCRNRGICSNDSFCLCSKGYTGVLCEQPLCTSCIDGVCIAPENCECSDWTIIGKSCSIHITFFIIPIVIFSLIGLCFFFMWPVLKKRKEKLVIDNNWLINWKDVVLKPSEQDGMINKKSLFCTWGDQTWYIEKINSRSIPPNDKKVISEMAKLTKTRHVNLIHYGGCYLMYPNVSIFAEVAEKGSIRDILLNEKLEIGWEFGFSFLKDICSGMEFIHDKSEIKSHGRLKSTNCLVDRRWTVRISGFGAPSIRYGNYKITDINNAKKLGELFWTAPELIGDNTNLDAVKSGTPEGDVYSFAIVACEIATKLPPYTYELEYLSAKSILDLIKNGQTPANKSKRKLWEGIGGGKMIFTRPILKEETLPQGKLSRKLFKKMLEESWNQQASTRPTFSKIGFILNQMHPIKGELIDKLIHLLETYSNNLEVTVVERTRELEFNKAKAELLLSQMLPPKVANEMKQGGVVEPELFECATVLFSDIVNFCRICRESKPIEIVDFLNEVYNVFDSVLDDYDVYKVESISDSYMVVSGLPVRNGDRHAGEIATMALDLMSRVNGFNVIRVENKTLQLRIGIHSGAIVTGVVGQLMPRFCLFGDTVNTASRMQSSSIALRIQVSETTAALLEQMGGYRLECRGQREVKGRGKMTTYWLWGKDTFTKELPDLSLAVPLEEHKFK
ncbi:atrial natriuretic peptide receptor 1-like [Argonauta hians]